MGVTGEQLYAGEERARGRLVEAPTAGPLLGLVMIVRNEVRRIVEVLASYKPHIDAWTVLDTGSTDGTQDLIRQELAGIPGTLHEEPFVDFATSRNRALDLHGEATTFSIMPNGDVLEGGAALRSFLELRRQSREGAYRVRIAPGHYYHPLVMRCGGGWRYKGRTHECAMGARVGAMIPEVIVHRDRGARTDAEWRERWERDLELLNRDREEDPSNPRPYFYLGQTHECLGQHQQALAFFERRAEMGGYFDEKYEAKFRVAKMLLALKRPWAEVQQAYLEAHALDPRRAEPLYAVASHWYSPEGGQKHALARIFAAAAADLPKPNIDLFLDEEIYAWKAADMAAISSFYVDRKVEGRRFAEKALRARPHDNRIRANHAHYAPSCGDLFGATCRAVTFAPPEGWNASNPSVFRSSTGRTRCVVRCVNYRIVQGRYVTPKNDGVIQTRNYILDLDEALEPTATHELVEARPLERSGYSIQGFEDARLFEFRGRWMATATACDLTPEGRREIVLLEIGDAGVIERATPLRGPWSEHAQKNWMPFVLDEDGAAFVYSLYPTTLLSLDDGPEGPIVVPQGLPVGWGHGRLRGGSQGVLLEDNSWLFCVHDVAFPGEGRIYLHRFALLNPQLQLVAMSDAFYFEKLGIEFCAGLAKIGDQVVASYAINDGAARLAVFDVTKVRAALRTDFIV